MENILVNGFDNETSGSGEHLVTKIADLGMGMLWLHESLSYFREWSTNLRTSAIALSRPHILTDISQS